MEDEEVKEFYSELNGELSRYVKEKYLGLYNTEAFSETEVIKAFPYSKIYFEKTPNLGVCPVFWLSLNKSGLAEFEGIRNIDPLGSFEGKVDYITFGKLCYFIEQYQIDQLEASYHKYGTCGSAEILKITKNSGEEVIISDYRDFGPIQLWVLQKVLKSIIYDIRWNNIPIRIGLRESSEEAGKALCSCGSGKRYENCHGFTK